MNNNELQVEENLSLDSFFEAIDFFINQRSKSNFLSEIVNQGLNVFLKFPNAINSSLFILNEDSFEFEHRATIPYTNKNVSIDLLNCLIDKNVIGESLEKKSIIFYPKDQQNNECTNCMIIPLLVSSGIFGLCIVTFQELPQNIDSNIIKLCQVYASYFAKCLETSILQKNLTKTQSLLEQKVAIRTMSLTQSNRELQTILNTIQTGIFVVDRENNLIINANLLSTEITKTPQNEIVGKNANSFFPNSANEVHNLDDKIMFSRNFESVVLNSDGDSIPILRTISNINLGPHKYRLESFVDITERKNAEIALRQANEFLELKVQERTEDLQLLVHKLKIEISERKKAEEEVRVMLEKEKELSILKSRFVSMVSHEFRTPLTIIKSAAQIIDNYNDKLSEFQKIEYLNRIVKTVDSMTDILENVLFIGKTESQKQPLNPKPINIFEVSKSIMTDLKLSINPAREVIFTPDCKVQIGIVDERLLKHILFNLLSNAFKYSPEDKPIEFSVYSDSEKSIFKIRDYGIGIPPEDQARIFEPFHRGNNVDTVSGTGLGMSVVLKSLELHGGHLDFQSELNQGTTFIVTLPYIKKV